MAELMTAKIGLFYGSSTCYTEMAAEKIRDAIHQLTDSEPVTLHNIADDPVGLINQYDYLILGIPTWDYGELQEDWEENWDNLDELDLKGKTIAVYGLGDQVGYPAWFQDALGYLWTKVKNQGASMVGLWPNQGYDFEDSKALTVDKAFFLGLPLDDENQLELTDPYIEQWSKQILIEFGLFASDT